MKYYTSFYNIYTPINDNIVIFNTLTRNLISLEKDLYEKIFISNEKSNNILVDEKNELYKLDFLIKDKQIEKKRMKYVLQKNKYTKDLFSVFISLTERCNFECTYCYQDINNKKEFSYLTKEKWKILYKYLTNTIEKNNVSSMAIVLFGGEPLLNYEIIPLIIDDLRNLEKNKKLKVYIQLITNGSLLTKERIIYLNKRIDGIQVTIDGNKKSHDKLRLLNDTGSFDIVFNNFVLLTKYFEGEITLRMNINENNINNAKEFLKYLKKEKINKKISSLSFSPIFSSQKEIRRYGHERKINLELESKIANLYLQAAKFGFKIDKEFVGGPCSVSLDLSFAVDENLNIYSCPGTFYEVKEGYIDENSNLKINNSKWYENISYEPECIENCNYAPICYGGCRWMGGNNKKGVCKKAYLDKNIQTLIKAYVISNYPLEV
ncbi:hypothetical protein XO11_04520 [Marinitoga sp. 1138]|nr:hypothetical protein [Marinitoga sp. 1138]